MLLAMSTLRIAVPVMLGFLFTACTPLQGVLESGGRPNPAPSILGFADPTTVHSGIAVFLTKGPISPVERVGATNSLPVAGAVVAILTADGALVGNLTTDSSGYASASLQPAGYVASVSVCPGVMRLAAPARVTVLADQVATLSLECDTGIR